MGHPGTQLPVFGFPVNYYRLQGDRDAFPNSLSQNDFSDDRTV